MILRMKQAAAIKGNSTMAVIISFNSSHNMRSLFMEIDAVILAVVPLGCELVHVIR